MEYRSAIANDDFDIEQKPERLVYVVATPPFVADALARGLTIAGWKTAAAMTAPASLVNNATITPDDVIVVVESEPIQVATVVPALRQLFAGTKILVIANSWAGEREFLHTKTIRPTASMTDVIAGLCDLTGVEVSSMRHGLTARHLEILQLIAEGKTTDDAGTILGIAPKTVNNHLSAVYRRLGARNLTQAVLLAARAGLVDVGRFGV